MLTTNITHRDTHIHTHTQLLFFRNHDLENTCTLIHTTIQLFLFNHESSKFLCTTALNPSTSLINLVQPFAGLTTSNEIVFMSSITYTLAWQRAPSRQTISAGGRCAERNVQGFTARFTDSDRTNKNTHLSAVNDASSFNNI